MAQDGDYPFFVQVWNRFESDVTLIVTFHHYPNSMYPGTPRSSPTNNNAYNILPGDSLAFPLFWGEIENDSYIGESLDIELTGNPLDPYFIWLGDKAKYELKDLHFTQYVPSGNNPANKSGLYKITDGTNNWIITVRKQMHDPQTDNVSVGPDIP
jgi:hypothetical protein